MAEIVILGCGYLGYNLYTLLNKQHSVEMWGIESPYTSLLPEYNHVDAFSKEDLARQDIQGKIFIDAIGIVANNATSENEEESLNKLRTLYQPLLESLKEKGAESIIYFSSGGTIYGDHTEPIGEDSPIHPTSLYAKSKAAIEQEIQSSGIPYLILRLSNPFGGYQVAEKKQGVIPILIRKALLNEPFEMWIEGTSMRDYFYITDLAGAIHALLECGINNAVLNIGSSKGTSLNTIISLVEESTEKKITVISKKTVTTGIQSIVLDTSKLKQSTGYTCRVSLEEGIALETKRIKGELCL